MHDKNKDAKSFTELGKYLSNGYLEPFLEPNQNSMVEHFCRNS